MPEPSCSTSAVYEAPKFGQPRRLLWSELPDELPELEETFLMLDESKSSWDELASKLLQVQLSSAGDEDTEVSDSDREDEPLEITEIWWKRDHLKVSSTSACDDCTRDHHHCDRPSDDTTFHDRDDSNDEQMPELATDEETDTDNDSLSVSD